MEAPEDRRLRVLLADEDEERLDEIADVVAALGHEVACRLTAVRDVAEAVIRCYPLFRGPPARQTEEVP